MGERRTHIGPWTVTVTQDMMPIYSDSPTSDEQWTFIDAAGHGHFFARESADRYPTLIWVSLPCSMGHGADCDGDGHWECRLCHETISPGTKPPSPYPTYISGMRSATVDYDDGREQKTWEVETESELHLLATDPVAGIGAVTRRDPISQSFSR